MLWWSICKSQGLAFELIHLPDEPAGVWSERDRG